MEVMTSRSVPFFNYPDVFTSAEYELMAVIQDVARRGAFILQRDLEEFEQSIAAYVGAKHAIGLANATDALHLAVRAAGIGPGDEVIFSSHTMVATPAAVHFAGATPVPVECGPDHLIDPAAVEAAVTPRTKAVIPTQLNGRVADMDALQTIADKHGLLILEDAAQALGAKFKGRCAGTFGLAGCTSFYPAKALGCLGDGGCLFVNDDDVYDRVRLLRDHGRNAAGDVVMWGLNSRLDNLQAAVLSRKLRSYDEAIQRRRELAAMYQRQLDSIPELRLPPSPDADSIHFDIYQNYEVEAEHRDALREHLKQCGVGTLLPWGGKAVHQFEKLGFSEHLPYTDELFDKLLMMPMNTSLSNSDLLYVCECISGFYASWKYRST